MVANVLFHCKVLQVVGGELSAPEEDATGVGRDGVFRDGAADLEQGCVERGGVFDGRQGVVARPRLEDALVVAAAAAAAERGTGAPGAGRQIEVAARGCVGDLAGRIPSPPPGYCGISRLGGNFRQYGGNTGLRGKYGRDNGLRGGKERPP